MKKSLKIVRCILLAVLASYLMYAGLSRLLYYYSWKRGDYPGPKYLINQQEGKQVDWLLIHGASMDARLWRGVLSHCSKQTVLAVSLGNHHLGAKLAEPGIEPSKEIVELLKHYHIKHGIIGHSSAAVWLANAYVLCPTCFKNLQVHLIAPNYCFFNITSMQKVLISALPSVYLGFGKVNSCNNSPNYEQCKKDYLFGRKYCIFNTNYYKKLINLCEQPSVLSNIQRFKSELAGEIHYYIADGDAVIDNQRLIETIKDQKIVTIKHSSHHDSYTYALKIMHCNGQ